MNQIGALAAGQLRAWEEIAETWVIVFVPRDGELHAICPSCDISIKPVQRDGAAYIMTTEELRAAIVMHLRNRHRDLDPDKAV